MLGELTSEGSRGAGPAGRYRTVAAGVMLQLICVLRVGTFKPRLLEQEQRAGATWRRPGRWEPQQVIGRRWAGLETTSVPENSLLDPCPSQAHLPLVPPAPAFPPLQLQVQAHWFPLPSPAKPTFKEQRHLWPWPLVPETQRLLSI